MGYYTAGTPATANTLARAENIAAELATIVAAFNKIPEQLSLEQGRAVYALDTGVANAYVVALPATLAAYTDGLNILMKAVNLNTGASTLNVDGLGVKSIKRLNGDALVAGDIPAGAMVGLYYDGANFQLATQETGTIPIASGGTGAESASAAFDNLKQAATESATGVVELATQAEVDAGTDTTRVVTPATLNASKNYSVTHTSDTALDTRAFGGTQIGSTLSSTRIPTAGVVRVTLLEAEFDNVGITGDLGIGIDVGGTKVWAVSENKAGLTIFTQIKINADVASRKINTGIAIDSGLTIFSFDIVAKSFPTGSQDVKVFMGDLADAVGGEITLTGTTVTCRILVEVIDTT